MAGFTVYDVVITTFINGLKTFDHILSKAEEYAEEKGLDVNTVFAEARLIQDQNPLTFQVQNATKVVKLSVGRLTGVELEPFSDKEKTIEDLHKRIQDTLQLLKSIKPDDVNPKGDEEIEVPFGRVSRKNAVLAHGIPNFFFHLTTAYSILRHKGVPLGKADFITDFIGQR
ncbi:hypothetical protein NKR23_g5685 [Pleurostoma richardsiae]|uniref:Helix-turn-helix-domain containing protein type n=1 Tax=Pleurostoma richardsiae TaxID=41990 RepID=A0AA38RF72_9PEZI|nr:hypothetical protein NKR23_g5685 [Pleurostoma richardsiae]